MNRSPTLRVLLQHLRENPPGPGIHHVEVQHDDDCRIFRGGTCNCEPTLESGQRVERKYGGQHR